ncbi:MAG: hypothetical protein ACLTU3_15215 [Acutalibacteraceae bacterium]
MPAGRKTYLRFFSENAGKVKVQTKLGYPMGKIKAIFKPAGSIQPVSAYRKKVHCRTLGFCYAFYSHNNIL